MIRPLKTSLIALAATAVAALAFTVSPAMAGGKPDCWKLVINDWYDGSITGKYELHCYREALAHLGSDTKGYSSAYDDINRALQRRINEIAAAKQAKSKTPPVSSTKPVKLKPQKNNRQTIAAPVSNDNNDSNSSGPVVYPSGPGPKPPPSVGAVAQNHKKNTTHAPRNSVPVKHSTPKTTSPGVSKTTKPAVTPLPGRHVNDNGPVTSAIKSLGPSDATSVPIPLLVLAGLAGLLMLVGAGSLVAKRAQSRRIATVPVRSGESH
jgi:hypothetical protein